MSYLDDELRSALQKKDAPPGFTDRVLSRIAASEKAEVVPQKSLLRFFKLPRTRWGLAAAAAVLLIVFTVIRFEPVPGPPGTNPPVAQDDGQLAKEQLMLALRITSTKLDEVEQKVVRHVSTIPEKF